MYDFPAIPPIIEPKYALPGRKKPVKVPKRHKVLSTPMTPPFPDGTAVLYVAMGCFWGAEKTMWQLPGVYTTAVGFQGGFTENASYEQVCTGQTGHAETVLVAYDPTQLSHLDLLRVFWQDHDPTQGFRQGNDRGTQYRSALFYTCEDQAAVIAQSEELFAARLHEQGYGPITTQILSAEEAGQFYYAEAKHQQYLAKNPGGYCPIHATGVQCH